MMIDRIEFYDRSRKHLFPVLTHDQTIGCDAIFDEWERQKLSDVRKLSCMIGQSYWETNRTMAPVREAYFLNPPGPNQNDASGPAEDYRRLLRYYPFYGRGLIQITWESNYHKMGSLVGVDLVRFPDRAMELDIAVSIVFEGMLRANSHFGDFTGVSLDDYFVDGQPAGDWSWLNQRRVVNGMDHAQEIADICKQFWWCLGGPEIVRTLRIGDHGLDVQLVQDALRTQGFLSGKADGDFGPMTANAVIAFQRAKGIGIDGEVGPQTRKALNI